MSNKSQDVPAPAAAISSASLPMSPTASVNSSFSSTTSLDTTATTSVTHKKLASSSSYLDVVIETLLPWTAAVVWPLMFTLPLILSTPQSPLHYSVVFPATWYDEQRTSYHDYNNNNDSSASASSGHWPKPLGLTLGILAVAVGQVFVWIVFYLFKFGHLSSSQSWTEPLSIQTKGARAYDFWEGLQTHLAQPGGFALLIGYLSVTWLCNLLPLSYYSFQGTIQWPETFLCLVVQDGMQYLMHYLEHVVHPTFYQYSHKPHHRFTNPRLFDAFDGSLLDTFCMIVIPLFATANLVPTCNVWTYMAFGSSYACWLTLIHSEYVFPWDNLFRRLGFGTPADHHVHHKVFKFNYGHLFMWFDQMAGTYRDPRAFAPRLFNPDV